MNGKIIRNFAWGVALAFAPLALLTQAPAARGPVELRVDNLRTPLGIDDPAPRFSWQLRDPAQGARQSAYQVDVAEAPPRWRRAKPMCGQAGA